MKKLQKIISALLALCLLMSFLPATVLAASGTEDPAVDIVSPVVETVPSTQPEDVPTEPVITEPSAPEPTVPQENEEVQETASTVVESGKCGADLDQENLKWTLYSDGHLVITGSGDMHDYDSALDYAPWRDFGLPDVTSVSLPEGLTSIGDHAFANCPIKVVDIPESVYSIGKNAFLGNEAIEYIKIPSRVTTIHEYTFASCASLKTIVWPTSLYAIGGSAFKNCDSITKLEIPDTVMVIDSGAFMGCNGLTEITLPSQLKEVSDGMFYLCTALPEITLPDSVTRIGVEAFYQCTNLETIHFSKELTTIDQYAFYSCGKLSDLQFPDKLKTIEYMAFDGCHSLETLTFPASLRNLGSLAFNRCTKLTDVTFNEGIQEISVGAFWYCYALERVTLPQSLQSILGDAFANCSSLTQINIPFAVTHIGSGAFSGCSKLTSIALPESLLSISDRVFSNCSALTDITFSSQLESIGESAFSGCSSLERFTGPNTVTDLGAGAFSGCFKLTDITLPAGLTELSNNLFYNCSALSHIDLPQNLTSIGDFTFSGCRMLNDVVIPDSVTAIGTKAFDSCRALTHIELPDSLVSLGTSAFSYCEGLTHLDLPDGLTAIDNNTFFSCSALESIFIPTSVTQIGENAFWHCKSLKEITIPAGVTKICKQTFYGCAQLCSIILPDTITSIEAGAFQNCTALADIYFSGTENQWYAIPIGNNNGVLQNATVHFGGILASGQCTDQISWKLDLFGHLVLHGTGAMPDYLDADAVPWSTYHSRIRSVSVREGITHIGNYAFAQCGKMTSVSLPGSLVSIGDYAFYGCNALKQILYGEKPSAWKKVKIGKENDPLKNAALTSILIFNYAGNGEIEINGCGSACAYYRTEPNTSLTYMLDGEKITATSDQYGILSVPLGRFTTDGTYKIPISFCSFDQETLDEPIVMEAVVNVIPVSFSQEWDLSLDSDVEFALSVPIKAFDLSFGGEGSRGSALKISREFKPGNEKLELTTEQSSGRGLKTGFGLSLKAPEVSFTVGEISGDIKSSLTETYGLQAENYSPDNSLQQRLIGIYLLGSAADQKQDSIILKSLYSALVSNIDKPDSCEIIEGSTSTVDSELGAKLGALEVNGKDVFTALGYVSSGSVSYGVKTIGTGGKQKDIKTAEFSTDRHFSILPTTLNMGSVSTEVLELRQKIMSNDLQVTLDRTAQNPKLEYSSLIAQDSSHVKSFIVGQHTLSDYQQYTFEGDALNRLTQGSANYYSYVHGNNDVLTAEDISDLADIVANNTQGIPYQTIVKDELLHSFPLKIGDLFELEGDTGGELSVDSGLNVEVSYLEETSYAKQSGYTANGQLLITSQSDDLSGIVKDNKRGPAEILTNVLISLAEDVKELFETVVGSIKDGLQTTWYSIAGEKDAQVDWNVSVTALTDNANQPTSYAVDTLQAQSNARAGSAARNAATASTIGRPLILGVTDRKTGKAVSDLRAQPLRLTIRYTEADLEAAGLSKYSSTVTQGKLAIYRYDNDNDCFVYVGGVNDLQAMCVTAQITAPGQYILAADNSAPTIRSLTVSHNQATPTITAYLDDQIGLDMSKFRFALDGTVRVDGSNIANHYQSGSACFTYTVPTNAPLSEGEHTITITLTDTTGNTETYHQTFFVDLTVPVIAHVNHTGTVAAGDTLRIRAQVEDENLSAVYAMVSTLQGDGTWSEEAPMSMANTDDGFWSLDYAGCGASVMFYITAEDVCKNTASSQVYDVAAPVEGVRISQQYITLQKGQTAQLSAQVLPAELAGSLHWCIESDAQNILSVNGSGLVTALNPGTAYVLATASDGKTIFTARCRVDVTEETGLEGIRLSTQKLTTQLYSTAYSKLDVLLMLPQNNTTALSEDAAPMGIAIKDAWFTDAQASKFFSLQVLDDRTLAVVPTQYAIDHAADVKSAYTSSITVKVWGQEYVSENLSLSVKKSKPQLKGSVGTFNAFFSNQQQPILITGGTVTGISENTQKEYPLPDWLHLSGTSLVLTDAAPAKNATGKAYLLVDTEEWRIPAELTLTVKSRYQAPGLKLSASKVTMSTQASASAGISMTLQCKSRKDTLSGLSVSNITAPSGYYITDFDPASGTFTLHTEAGFQPGKIDLQVAFRNTRNTVPVKLSVKTAPVSLKLSAKSIRLNAATGDSARIRLTAAPADHQVTAPEFRLTDASGNDMLSSGHLLLGYDGNVITVSTTQTTPENASYKLYVRSGDSKEAVLTITTFSAVPSVSLKVKGSPDLSFPDRPATLSATFRNHAGGIRSFEYSVFEKQGSTVLTENLAGSFLIQQAENNTFLLYCTDPNLDTKNSYVLNLKLVLPDGSSCDSSVTVKLKRTPVKLKLSATKLTLNKLLSSHGQVTVSCATKGYSLGTPVWQLMDSRGKVSAEGKLDIQYAQGKLTIQPNGQTQYGVSYKLLVKADPYAPASTITITIPTQAKSQIVPGLKASGTLDVIRDGSSITLTPSYKNIAAGNVREEDILIYSSDDNYTNPVNHLFTVICNGKGGYLLSKAPGARMDHSAKYKAKLVATFPSGATAESAMVPLKVTMGKAKLTVQAEDTSVFTKDKYDRIVFRFSSKDANLNEVTQISIKDSKYQNMFEIVNYDNGLFALGFKDGAVNTALAGTGGSKVLTLNLSVWIAGNQTAKANTTVKFKVTLRN